MFGKLRKPKEGPLPKIKRRVCQTFPKWNRRPSQKKEEERSQLNESLNLVGLPTVCLGKSLSFLGFQEP